MSGAYSTPFSSLLSDYSSAPWAAWIPALQANIQQSASTLAILMDDDQCDDLLTSLRDAQEGRTVAFMDAFDDC